MMKSISILIFILTFTWNDCALAVRNSSVNMDIEAESVARISIYYLHLPVTSSGINFPLPINGISERFERTSNFIYLVGNVEQADVVFSDSKFELISTTGRDEKINLLGDFIYQGVSSNAQQMLQVPVLKKISDATIATGFKVRFRSEFTSGVYTQDIYANTFTLLVTPKI